MSSTERGFTLLEVMIALAILAIAFTALLSLSNSSISARGEVQRLTRGTLLAEQVMTEVETNYKLGRQSEIVEQGVFEPPFEAFHWEIDFTDTMLPSILQVNVSVLWGAAEKNEKVELNSFVFRAENL